MQIRDVYPGSPILIIIHPGSRISDPTTAPKEEGGKKLFFSQNTKNYSTFYPKFVIKLSKTWVWDPRSGIQGQEDTGSRIQILNTGFVGFYGKASLSPYLENSLLKK